jgi:hypothetical protein
MANRDNLVSVLRTSERQDWWESLSWLAYSLIGGLLPLWGGLLLLYLFGHHDRWPQLISHGEFAIYSAALLAPAVYVILKQIPASGFVHQQAFVLLAFVGLLVSAILFTGVTILAESDSTFLRLNQDALFRISVPLFVVSLAFAFVVTLLDNARLNPDVRRLAEDARRRLEEQFAKTEDGK